VRSRANGDRAKVGILPHVAIIGRTHLILTVAGNGKLEVVKGVYMMGFMQPLRW
jgi:hypothetical protein